MKASPPSRRESSPGFSVTQARQLLEELRPMDRQLGNRLLKRRATDPLPEPEALCQPEALPFWLGAFVSHEMRKAHGALDLSPNRLLGDLFNSEDELPEWGHLPLENVLGTPETLLQRVPASVCLAGEDTDQYPKIPLVLRQNPPLLYFRRWFQMERSLARFFKTRLRAEPKPLTAGMKELFGHLFPVAELERNPWQAAACLSALRSSLTIITGGPGTGKTTTVCRMLLLLQQLPEAERPRNIHLVAQTGKAAERLREAFLANLETSLKQITDSDVQVEMKRRSEKAHPVTQTIHRLLGAQGLGTFKHHQGNPLTCDLLVVDEATMVDMELFSHLIGALPPQCRLVLLGDKNQLSAIETGNIFADLTFTAESHSADPHRPGPLNRFSEDFRKTFHQVTGVKLPAEADPTGVTPTQDSVVELRYSYRFAQDSPVAKLAKALLNEQKLPTALSAIGVNVYPLQEDWESAVCTFFEPLRELLGDPAGGAGQPAVSPQALLEAIAKIRLLGAVRRGPQGIERLNALIAASVLGHTRGLDAPLHGLPLMVTRNDPETGLFNGDSGIFARDPANGELCAWFPAETGAPPRRMRPFLLPEWEPAFAITIHKSQGSEYDRVLIVLPEHRTDFLSWELVYTAITRARKEVALVLPDALPGLPLPRIQRKSGLCAELEATL
jgi:exodeoxyribonuclease V alpha subunit